MPATATKSAPRSAGLRETRDYKNYINGEWVGARSGKTFENRNPANDDDLIGTFQESNADDLNAAVDAADRAFHPRRLPPAPTRADYHGDVPFYPASLVKLFFMVEVYHQGKLTPEIGRALREMIQVSDNDAAAFLVDILTYTCSGSELEGKALDDFLDRRRQLNRYFASLGYDISAMMKPSP